MVKLQCINDAGYDEEKAICDSFQQFELVELLVSKMGTHPNRLRPCECCGVFFGGC